MIKEADLKNLIAKDKKELADFILNLSGFTLKQAGYNPQNYPFYLHVAFRHQVILQSEIWESICRNLDLRPLSWLPENEELRTQIASFAQSIVTEVVEASQDNWSIKLLKTSYFATLDRARKSSENASKRLQVKKHQKIEDIRSSFIDAKSDDETTQGFLDVLAAQRAYLDSLLALPFNLEKLCLSVAKNNMNANYQPRKAAEMLANTLDTINLALKVEGEGYSRHILIEGLKLALNLTMPDFQLADHQLVDVISNELLPFINQLIINNQNLERAKNTLLPKANLELSAARKKILASMDVHFYSINDILQETLIKPVEQCNHAIAGVTGMSVAVYRIAHVKNEIDRAVQIAGLFKNFDKVASACSDLDDALLPSWLAQANGYYHQLKNGVSIVNSAAQFALNGLGAFYNCPEFYNQLASYLPQSIRYYISQADVLTKIFKHIDKKIQKLTGDKVLAYFAFYELIEQGKIVDSVLKENLFEVYMAEVVKADNKLKWEEFKFDKYLLLETQLTNKFNLKLSLAKQMKDYAKKCNELPTESLIIASKAHEVNPRILDNLVLINRLQTLESDFEINKSKDVFSELVSGAKAAKSSSFEEIQIIYHEFFLPVMQRLNNLYQKERLIPLIEMKLESIDNDSHKLRKIYSKVKDDPNLSAEDLDSLESYFMTIPKDFKSWEFDFTEEFSFYVELAKFLPQSANKRIQDLHRKTPKELREETSAKTLENAKRLINPLLDELQNNLDEQNKKIKIIDKIELAKQKIAYIQALNGLINQLRKEINTTNSEMQKYLIKLLNGELRELTHAQIANLFSMDAIPSKLMNFAWSVLPIGPESTLFYNVLEYSFRDLNLLHQVIEAENNYNLCLNRNPIPALMNNLNDPLAAVNLIPSQEKIMDAIFANLIETGKQQTFSWGLNYLKELITSISYKKLIRFLPHPFLAELALMAINSQALQAHVAPVFNAMMNEYGEIITDELKKIAKKRLYPILGIEIQKTIESCAYNYVLYPDNSSDTNRDAFAMYYLQYREIRQYSRSFRPESTIKFLFPKLLEDIAVIEQEEIIAKISQAIAYLDKLLNYYESPKCNAIDEANQLLQFIIEHIDFEESSNLILIKLALLNRLLLMNVDLSEQLNDKENQNKLQLQAINHLSLTIKKIKGFADKVSEYDLILNKTVVLSAVEIDPELMIKTISPAKNRLNKQMLIQIKESSELTTELVNNELIQLNAMRTSVEPLLSLSLFEWNYHKSSLSRKIFLALNKVNAIVGPILTWVSIIGAASEGILAALGIAVGLGASITGIGLGVFFAGALCCLVWNFTLNILEELLTLKRISEENSSFWDRAGKIVLIVAKCLGMALLKTVFIDYLFNILKNLFAAEPLAEAIDLISFWPTEQRVEDEIKLLESLQGSLVVLADLIDTQVNFIENKINPHTQEKYTDQSEKIANQIAELSKTIAQVEALILKANLNDARLIEKNYQLILDAFTKEFEGLKAEISLWQNLQDPHSYRIRDSTETQVVQCLELVDSSLPKTEDKPVLVNMLAYKEELQKQPSNLFTNFFNRIKSSVTPSTGNEAKEILEPQESGKANPLTVSGDALVKSILEGISASSAEPIKTKESCEISQKSSSSYSFGWFSKRNKQELSDSSNVTVPQADCGTNGQIGVQGMK